MFFESKKETSLKTIIFKFNFVICFNFIGSSTIAPRMIAPRTIVPQIIAPWIIAP